MVNTMIVLGSGGHTSEMMALLSGVPLTDDHKYSPITFVTTAGDLLSGDRVKHKYGTKLHYNLLTTSRTRSVGQSYWTSIVTTLISIYECLMICLRIKAELVLCNGPAICVAICLSARLTRRRVVIVYVESFCRTETLSLSAKIIYYLRLADEMLVQWPQLSAKYKRCKYIGLLV